MTTNKTTISTCSFEEMLASSPDLTESPYLLKLYVLGATPNSQRAIKNIKDICEQHLQGRYTLKVIDLYQQPQLAEGEQIVATPTLVKKLPLPLRRILGDLSNTERVLVGLNLRRIQ